jgi:4-amino-4-deoxy-L-arabinose transferase-like glycosyltransferase
VALTTPGCVPYDRMSARDDFSATLTRRLAFDGSRSPIKSALFIILCAAYILPGLIGHDPWKPDEASAFGPILDLLRGGTWWWPTLAGKTWLENAPLYNWLAAAMATVFSPWLPLHDGARLTSGLLVTLTAIALHRTAIELNDERAGRLAVVVLFGSLGLVFRAHEINPELAGWCGTAIAICGSILVRRRLVRGTVLAALGVGMAGLGSGWVLGLATAACVAATSLASVHWREPKTLRGMAIAIGVGLAIIAIWPVCLWLQGKPVSLWLQVASGSPLLGQGGMRTVNPTYVITNLVWFALPAWPVAVVTLWYARRQLKSRLELAIPLAHFVILLVALSFFAEPSELEMAPLLLPLALLAVAAVDRMRRSFMGAIDWFGIMCFVTLCGLLWAGWLGYTTGIPTGAARWAAARVPGYVHIPNPAIIGLAIGVTLLWLTSALRARSSNRRAFVNWTAGLAAMWFLTHTLWVGALDHARSYRSLVAQVEANIPRGACVRESGLGSAQRASFDYFAARRFSPNGACDWWLVQGTVAGGFEPGNSWEPVWQGARPGEGLLLSGSKSQNEAERFRLYRKREVPIVAGGIDIDRYVLAGDR